MNATPENVAGAPGTTGPAGVTGAAGAAGVSGDAGVRPVRRALLSVYDKTGLTELAEGLSRAGVELVSTGSTAATIEVAGVPVTRVEQVTGFPECLDGRVKTLHPGIHAGLLADLRNPDHIRQLDELEIAPFDLLVSNLYPFTQTVASGARADEIIEMIDIGGPAMVRSAAKNHASVAVVVSPNRYADVLAAATGEGFTLDQRRGLAAEAFVHVADYDVQIASWIGDLATGGGLDAAERGVAGAAGNGGGDTAAEVGTVPAEASSAPAEASSMFPAWVGATWQRKAVLRYGENPHQPAALYTSTAVRGAEAAPGAATEATPGPGAALGATPGLAQAEQLHGKEMSYNNYVDADAARRAAYDFEAPCVAIIKHANPCGIAVGADIAEAHRKAQACDPVSAFGGVIATNRAVSAAMAEQVAEVFTEVVVAPEFEAGALEVLTRKKNIRLLRCAPATAGGVETRAISGGLLLQRTDAVDAPGDDPATWRLVAGEPVAEDVLADLAFAWRAVRAVKSNAILLASGGATVGVGMGQVNRVDSAKLAVARAGERAEGSVAASDAFFPFADGLQVLLDAGVRAVVEPGGSVRDAEVIAAATSVGVPLYFTGTRHFFH